MEKNTPSTSAMINTPSQFCTRVRRLFVMALLALAIAALAIPGSMPSVAATQMSYRVASFAAGSNPSAAKIGDLDGDGLNDIAVVNTQGSLQLFFNRGDGSFERTSLNGLWPSSSNTLGVDIGDLNRDGRNDLAVAFLTSTGSVSVLLNQGSRAFSTPVNYTSCGSANGVAIGDLDQDGDNDVADIGQCASSSVLLNNGQGSLTLNGSYGTGQHSRSVVLADFNRDGIKDIVYVNNGININGSVTTLLNNGNGTFGAARVLSAGDLPDDVAVGDFDGDGNTDLAIANSYLSLVTIVLNDTQGTFTNGYSELGGGDTPTSIAAGDFNGDGRLDFAVTSWGTGGISVFLNQGNYNFAHAGTQFVLQRPVDLEAGNLDGDSLPDLVAVNQGNGTISVFSTSAVAPPPPPPPPPPAPTITVTVSTSRTKTARLVELSWTGATSSSVDIYRNGSRIATVSNSGRYTDRFARNAIGTYTYKVCNAGSQQCSNQVSVGF
jgi:hypothetical protein